MICTWMSSPVAMPQNKPMRGNGSQQHARSRCPTEQPSQLEIVGGRPPKRGQREAPHTKQQQRAPGNEQHAAQSPDRQRELIRRGSACRGCFSCVDTIPPLPAVSWRSANLLPRAFPVNQREERPTRLRHQPPGQENQEHREGQMQQADMQHAAGRLHLRRTHETPSCERLPDRHCDRQ